MRRPKVLVVAKVLYHRRASNANRWLAETMNLYHGDCLEILPTFPPASVEAIITDLPYGTTACEWDSIIPLDEMWKQVKKVLKPNGVFITTASQPFTSVLIMSNLEWFKYELIWDKLSTADFLLAKYRPMKYHENIVVFSKGATTYNPQMTKGRKNSSRGNPNNILTSQHVGQSFKQPKDELNGMKYPRSILEFQKHVATQNNHPSEKPLSLIQYIIFTYTNAGETVLDICMGSGTTGVAAIQTGRNFIGIEKEQKYFEVASRRIAQAPQPLFTEPPRQPTQREPDKGNVTLNFEGFE